MTSPRRGKVDRIVSSARMRTLARLAIIAGSAFASAYCGPSGRYGVTSSGNPTNPGNPTPPTAAGIASASIILPAKSPGLTPFNVGDSVLVQFRVSSAKKIAQATLTGQARRGNVNLGTDTVVNRFTKKIVPVPFVTDTIMSRFIYAIPGDSTAETVYIVCSTIDSLGNTGVDTTTIRVAPGPHVVITAPQRQSQVSSGKSVTVTIHVTAGLGTRIVGWRAVGVAPVVLNKNDSTIYPATSLPKDTLRTDTLTIPGA